MSKAGLSIADLQSAAKRLNTVDNPPVADSKGGAKSDRAAIEALGKVFIHFLFRLF
jgi:hypothetical protein